LKEIRRVPLTSEVGVAQNSAAVDEVNRLSETAQLKTQVEVEVDARRFGELEVVGERD